MDAEESTVSLETGDELPGNSDEYPVLSVMTLRTW